MSTINEILKSEKPLRRSFLSREINLDETARTVELSFSSEEPILHWFGYLILDHSTNSVDLERINSGGALLYGHDRNKKIGAVTTASIGKDRKGRATVKFSRGAFASEKFEDVKDGIEQTVSVGFEIRELELAVGSDGKEMEIDGETVYICRNWCPYEVSLEPIPADITVGVGRAKEEKSIENLNSILPEQRETEKKMPENENENTPQLIAVSVADRTASTVEEYVRFAKLFDKPDSSEFQELARDYGIAGKSFDDLKKEINERRNKQAQLPQKPPVDLTNRELENYSITRALLNHTDKKGCLELEISQELNRKIGGNTGGIMLPFSQEFCRKFAPHLTRAGLDTATDTKGAEVVFTQPGTFIEMLRNKAKVMQLGATVFSGLTGGEIEFPRQTGSATVADTTENPGSANAVTELTLANIKLIAQSLQATTKYSRQLLLQNTFSIDQIVLADLIAIHALKVDYRALHSSRGLYAQSGVNAVAFGGAITYAKVVECETAIADVNADIGNMAYLTTSKVRGAAKTTQKFASTNGVALWENNEMNGYRAEATNQLSKVMNVSAATGGSGHGFLFGVWSELMIGEWGTLEILTDPYTDAGKAMINVHSFQMVDSQARNPEAFAKGTGLTVA